MKKKVRLRSHEEIQALPPEKRGWAAMQNETMFAHGDRVSESELKIDTEEADNTGLPSMILTNLFDKRYEGDES